MRILVTLFILFIGLTSFAHRGTFLAINNVQITETPNTYIYTFEVENIHMVEVRDIKIEFVINRKSVFQKYYPYLKAESKSFLESFEIPKKWLNPERDFVQIEITEIFGKKQDWGGWDSPNMKAVNTVASDFIADAPWRMKKTDGNGDVVGVPVHIFLHDADVNEANPLIGGNQVDYIDIKIKNCSDNSFPAPLTYDTLSVSAYNNLFSCLSPQDNVMSIQEFNLNTLTKSPIHTIDFNFETDFWTSNYYLQVIEDFWYCTFTIPPENLVGMGDVFDIDVYIKYDNAAFNLTEAYDEVKLRVFRSNDDIPTQSNFYRGDTHLHSMYTQNSAEIGNPLCGTKQAAQQIGLDWITTTDHTSDFDNYGDGNINNNWSQIKAEAAQLNSEDASLIFIPGQEVAVNNSNDDLVHMLAYPSYTSVSTFPFLGDGNGDLSGTSKTVDIVAAELSSFGGFSYAAHPFATESKLPTIPVGGGIWNLGDAGFATNGSDFPRTGGNIIANDPNLSSDILLKDGTKLIKDGIKGSQIWNVRNTLTTSGDQNDPWDVLNLGDPFVQFDTTSLAFHIKKFRQGQEISNYINLLGLQLKNQDTSYQNWKMYISAGADAHGSFNYSNTGDFASLGSINNNAVGKLTTVAYSENGMGANGENVLKAMYFGHTTLSDGPILSIGVSTDGANTSNEILMGDDEKIFMINLDKQFVNLHYTTTTEFGSVTKLTFIIGTETGEVSKDLSLSSFTGDNQLSYSLQAILDSVIGYSNIDLEKYFYVRAELQTYRDYSGETAIRRTDHDYFHSFTNPIWIKLTEELPIEVTDFELESYPNPFNGDFNLIIKNPGKEDIRIGMYDDIGRLVYSQEVYVDNYKQMTLNATELGLSNGMYTIRAVVRDKSAELKVVKY